MKPRVSIWSQFRDAGASQISLYRKQIEDLDYPAELIRVYASEGDSQDDTLAQLQAWAVEDERVRVSHANTGLAREWHTTRPDRMRAMAIPGNKNWDAIAEEMWGDFALMLEGDVLYQPDLIERLVGRRPEEADLLAPMIWIQEGGRLRFYDVWAFRQHGRMFLPGNPAWYAARYKPDPFQVESVGSVVLFKMEVITAGVRLSETSAVVGMCEDARRRGYRIFVDPETHVLHPMIEGVM